MSEVRAHVRLATEVGLHEVECVYRAAAGKNLAPVEAARFGIQHAEFLKPLEHVTCVHQ